MVWGQSCITPSLLLDSLTTVSPSLFYVPHSYIVSGRCSPQSCVLFECRQVCSYLRLLLRNVSALPSIVSVLWKEHELSKSKFLRV